MTNSVRWLYAGGFALFMSAQSSAQEVIELDTTTITGNTELPKVLYVVPWQDKTRRSSEAQKLVLHNLYSDLFDPVMPAHISAKQYQLKRPDGEPKK